MSDFPAYAEYHRAQALADMCARFMRPVSALVFDPAAGTLSPLFDPPLTPEEQTTLDGLTAIVGRPVMLTPDEMVSIGPHLVTIRTFQQMSRADFMALTAAERDRLTFDELTALIRILRAFLRD